MKRKRGEAFEGKGYGTLRYMLYRAAGDRIEQSITSGYYLEAVTLIESVISDRLESRVSYKKHANIGFRTLGNLINESKGVEDDPVMLALIAEVDQWREQRNQAIHELVKIERDKELTSWEDRLAAIKQTAEEGYYLLKRLYNRVADLNPYHPDRVFRIEQ